MPEDLMEVLATALKSAVSFPDLTQLHGFVQKDREGFHIVYKGKRYLLTVTERPENDGGMALYEV